MLYINLYLLKLVKPKLDNTLIVCLICVVFGVMFILGLALLPAEQHELIMLAIKTLQGTCDFCYFLPSFVFVSFRQVKQYTETKSRHPEESFKPVVWICNFTLLYLTLFNKSPVALWCLADVTALCHAHSQCVKRLSL